MAVSEFAPAWIIIEGVKGQCANTFTCDEIEVNDKGEYTAFVYAAYKDPRALIPKFTKAGGQVIKISGGKGNWWHYTFTVRA